MAKPTKHELAEVVFGLSSKISNQKLAVSLANYLQQENRTGELDAIMREVKFLRQEKDGVEEADVVSAFPLSPASKKKIKELFGKNILINEEVDKSVIGGVRVETNDPRVGSNRSQPIEQTKKYQRSK